MAFIRRQFTPPSYIPTGDTPLSLNEHPRLMFTAAEVPAMAARVSSGGEWNSDFIDFLADINADYATSLGSLSAVRLGYLCSNAALVYQLAPSVTGVTLGHTQNEFGDRAVAWALELISRDTANGITFAFWPPFVQVSLTFDWAYARLSSGDKTTLMTWAKGIDNEAAISGNNPPSADHVRDSWPNNQFTQAWGNKIIFGLASFGSGADDTWSAASYDVYNSVYRGTWGLTTMETTRGGADGGWSQGAGYGLVYDMFHLVMTEACWRTSNAISKAVHYTAAASGHIMGEPLMTAYRIRPLYESWGSGPNGKIPRMIRDQHVNWDNWDYNSIALAASYGVLAGEFDGTHQDLADLSRWELNNLTGNAISSAYASWWGLTKFLRAKGTDKSPTTLGMPTSRAFQPGEWHFASSVLGSAVESRVWIHGFKHTVDVPTVGNFAIDYMGPAIVIPGVGGHDFDAIGNCGASNTVGAPESTRTTVEAAEGETGASPRNLQEDFGYGRHYFAGSLQLIAGGAQDFNDLSLVKFLGIGANNANEKMGYLYLDQRRGHNSDLVNDNADTGQAVKFSDINRTFVIRNPTTPGTDSLRVWIYDTVTTKTHTDPFEKRATFYLTGDPTIDGTETTGFPSRGTAGTTGKNTYAGATLVHREETSLGAGNKTWLRVTSPTSTLKVVEVNCKRNTTALLDFETAYGGIKNPSPAGSAVADGAGAYLGSYRVEAIPTSPINADEFVTSIEVTVDGGSEGTNADLTASGYRARRIGDTIVAFCTTLGGGAGSITLPASFTGKLFLCKIATGAARGFSAGADITAITRTSDGGNAITGVTASSAGTSEVDVTTGSGGSRVLTIT